MDSGLKDDFFAEIDCHYESVMEGVGLVREGKVSEGVKMIFRPIHTIKGTAGFLSGLEVINKFAHKVEDYLDGVRKDTIPHSPQVLDPLMQAVEEVFSLLDQAQKNEKIDDNEGRKILAEIEEAINPTAISSAQKDEINIERKNEVCIFRISIRRIHLPRQYQLLIDAFRKLGNGEPVVLDMSQVRSLASTAWGRIFIIAKKHKITMIEVNQFVRSMLSRWEFDQYVEVFQNEAEFWQKREED